MPIVLQGRKLYRIGEALAAVDVSRSTYFRWLKCGKIRDTQYKDRNGRRVFTEGELEELKNQAQQLVEAAQISLRFGGQ